MSTISPHQLRGQLENWFIIYNGNEMTAYDCELWMISWFDDSVNATSLLEWNIWIFIFESNTPLTISTFFSTHFSFIQWILVLEWKMSAFGIHWNIRSGQIVVCLVTQWHVGWNFGWKEIHSRIKKRNILRIYCKWNDLFILCSINAIKTSARIRL